LNSRPIASVLHRGWDIICSDWSINARLAFGAQDPEQPGVKGEMHTYDERYMSPATIRRYMEEAEKTKRD
jgi:hypothetical protein